ncbi:unnamed protein product [Polarella glacialis]|uniref:Uncharacterized protein n=1 Tax=Polarella glacialis TaxID=89957 RepID=A0A813GNK7_POLGL|nr:unnamed protein product [Polarella glacialis]
MTSICNVLRQSSSCSRQLFSWKSGSRNFGRSHWRVDDKDAHATLPAKLLAISSGKDFIKFAEKCRLRVDAKSGAKVIMGPPPGNVMKSIQQNSTPVHNAERTNILNAFYLMGIQDQHQWWCTLQKVWCEDPQCSQSCRRTLNHG